MKEGLIKETILRKKASDHNHSALHYWDGPNIDLLEDSLPLMESPSPRKENKERNDSFNPNMRLYSRRNNENNTPEDVGLNNHGLTSTPFKVNAYAYELWLDFLISAFDEKEEGAVILMEKLFKIKSTDLFPRQALLWTNEIYTEKMLQGLDPQQRNKKPEKLPPKPEEFGWKNFYYVPGYKGQYLFMTLAMTLMCRCSHF